MKFSSKIMTIACISMISFAANGLPAEAGAKTKLSVMFKDFPKGTACNATGTQGKVNLKKKKGHPLVNIKGYPEVGTIFCDLPDGRKIVSGINKKIRDDARVVGVTVYPNGKAYVTSSTEDSGLIREEFNKMIRVAK